MSAERRACRRAPAEVGATLFVGSKRIPCRLLNVSASGIGLFTSFDGAPRAAVRVEFLLPGELRRISVDAILARHERQGLGVQWGVTLLDPKPEVTSQLGDFVGKVLGVEPPSATPASTDSRKSGIDLAQQAESAEREQLRRLRLQALMRRAVEDMES